jgi:hypothetical protein
MNRKYNGHTFGFWLSYYCTILCAMLTGGMVAQKLWLPAVLAVILTAWWGVKMSDEAKEGGKE